jgi:isoleucyl-tRNA synthetase
MSKRLGNAVDPFETINKYGSDALRWYMITNASPWDNIKFDIEGIEEVRRKFFGTLYNTYSFFALYANVDGFSYNENDIKLSERPEIDRWILSLLNSLVKETDQFYKDYEPTRAGRAIADFVNDHLSNWYVRLNRKRFWGGGLTTDKLSAFQTLYTCLETISKLMAPIAPFYAEKLYQDLTNGVQKHNASESVHLADFPVCQEDTIDTLLEDRMKLAQNLSSMVLALRRKVAIKVRQPLQTILVPATDLQQRENIEAIKKLVLDEVNVKEMKFIENANEMLVKSVKPDFKRLGPRYGKIMKQLAQAKFVTQDEIINFETSGELILNIEEQKIVITIDDVEIVSEDIPGWLVANEGVLTIALDVTLTDSLKNEGVARELVNRIQNLRKSKDFEITDKIRIQIRHSTIDNALLEYESYVANQVLAESIHLTDNALADEDVIDLDGFDVHLKIEKVK